MSHPVTAIAPQVNVLGTVIIPNTVSEASNPSVLAMVTIVGEKLKKKETLVAQPIKQVAGKVAVANSIESVA
jgi:hypothetical protein